jgi:hypothetical protein
LLALEPEAAGSVRSRAVRVGRSRLTREAILVGAVLAPVAADPTIRRTFRSLDRPSRAALGLMVGSALAGHFVLGQRSFPFVNWDMYTTPVGGDPVLFEYDAVLRGGTTIPLAIGRLLGRQSAARLTEALRRQVCGLQTVGEHPAREAGLRREHESALRAIAGRYNRDHAQDPVVTVVVSERTISIRSGAKSRSRTLWAVDVP